MTEAIQEVYEDINKCRQDIILARKIFGDKTTTEKQYDAMEKSLGMMFLYCPEEIKGIVQATLWEAQRRRFYFEMNIWDTFKNN
jgi:hypothetical protein